MQSAETVGVVIAGLFFSLMCALLLEELVFGGLFRFFFAPRVERPAGVNQPTLAKGRQGWGTRKL